MLFFCPRMFYTNQNLVRIENEYDNQFDSTDYIEENKTMPPKYFLIDLDTFNYIQLNFALTKTWLRK